MGDPCGIGAEIIIKALADDDLRRRAKYVLFGFSEQFTYTADAMETEFSFFRDRHEEVRRYLHDLVVLDYDEISPPAAMPRGPSKLGGQASMAFCEGAIAAARARIIDAVVTAPISKTSWQMAGFKKYPGHTELLADKCKTKHVAMMFASPQLRVVLATIHVPLSEVPRLLTRATLERVIRLTAREMPRFGFPRPRLAVAGLNPHAGEHGVLGSEEREVFEPAIAGCRADGIDVAGPFPADTLFTRAVGGEFDIVVASYHDQGLIPIKLLAFGKAVNVTLGLPIIRTSVDHGTAFDIAGRGLADHGSLVEAIRLAARLAGRQTAPARVAGSGP